VLCTDFAKNGGELSQDVGRVLSLKMRIICFERTAGKADGSLNLVKTFTTRPMCYSLRCTDTISFRTVVTLCCICKQV
jgi:hypothetical protein